MIIKEPNFKIAITIASLYVLFLFVPTFDVAATYDVNFYFFSAPISLAGLIFPAIYPLADSITEVYGKAVSFYLAVTCYIIAVVFSFFNYILLTQSHSHVLYAFLLRSSLLLTIAGPIGYFITVIFNIKFLNKLKIKMRGKHFIVRSLVCSGLSEIIISFIIYPVIFYPHGFNYALMITLGTCIIKILLTIPMVFIAKFLVLLYQYNENIQITPFNESFLKNN